MATHGNDEREPEPLISSLQPDAEWKNIQQNTFTRWVNNHLKKVPDHIDHLESDLSDGLKLIKLVEVLAQKHVGRYSHQVKFRHQKLENVSVALKFLQDIERIKIINIDSSHIVDQNKKLILGLIWTLILHYSISVHMEDEDYPSDQTDKDKTPKQRLLQWIRRKLPDDVPVTNFTYDWNDGVALGGLVNSIAPGSIPDWRSWEPDNALENTAHAMQMANDELGIAPLITPEELINPNVDEKSVMTYLAQFPQVKNMQKQKEQSKVPVPKGKLHGVDLAPCVHKPTQFTVMMPSDDAKPKLMIQDENGADIHFILNKIPGTNNYTAKYTPEHIGYAKITLYTTSVSSGESALTDSADISVVQGARLAPYDTNRKVGDVAEFTVENGGEGPVEIVVVDGEGQEQKLAVTESSLAGSYSAQFDCDVPGLHSVNVFHKKAHIEGSPFPLRVKPKCSWEIWGRGIQPDGVRVGDKVPVYVQASTDSADVDISSVPLSIEVLDGRGNLLPVTKEVSDGRVKFEYVPNKEGPLEVVVKSDGEAIGHSPYEVSVSPKTDSPIRAFGPGLEGGIAEHANVFYVNTHGESDHLAFTIEGPSKTAIECSDRGNGVALVEYTPKESGIYKINVLSRGEHIQDSPFVVWVDPSDKTVHPSAVRVSGLESGRAVKDQPTKFRIDTKTAGADLIPQVSVIDAGYATAVPSMREVNPGLYECTFVPKHDGDHFVNVGVRGVAVPGSPFPLKVEDPVDISKLRIHGPGVEGPVISQKPTYFTIDAKQAGPGAVEVALADRQGRAVDIDVLDNQDGSFTVKYTAPRPGAYQLNVVFAGVDVPSIEINVKPHVNTAGIRVEGLENANVLVGKRLDFEVDVGENQSADGGLELIVKEGDGKQYAIKMDTSADGRVHKGHYVCSTPGKTDFNLLFDDVPVKHAVVQVARGQDASQVKAVGDGLSKALVGEPAFFDINTEGAGDGGLSLEIEGPAEAATSVQDHANGSCTVEYVPKTPGVYQLGIMYGDKKEHIPGSPFTAVVDHPYVPESVRVEGIANPVARLGESSKFVVDASKTAEAPVDARLPVGQQQPIVQPISGRSRAYSVNFTPHGKPGDVLPLEIMYDGKPVNGSPFPITLLPECQAENARVTEAAREKAVYAGQEATVSIDTSQCGKVDSVRAAVTGPDGHSRRCSVTPGHADYLHDLSWPTDVSGAYNVDVFVNDQKISAEPVKVHAKSVGSKYDVIVQDKPDGGEWLIGEDKYLSVDRLVDDPNARLAILKSHPDGCDSEIVTDRSGGKVRDLVRLRPAQPGKQSVNLVYGGEIVDSGDIAFEAVKELHVPEVLAKEKELSKEPIHTKTVTTPTQKTSPTSTRIGEFPSEQRRLSSSDRRSSQTSSQYTREELIERNEKRYYGRQESTGTTASHVGSLGSPPPSLRSPTSVRSPTVHPPTSPRSATGSLQDPLYERQFNFNFDPSQIDKSKLTAEVVMPKGKDTAEIVDNSDGTVTVRYTPKVTGPHELTILHDGAILQGTPLKFFVDNYSTGYATVYGPGLTSGVVGEPCTFTVCAKGSHAKELSVSIEGAAQANIKIHDNKDGTCSVSWVPPVPGEYKVFVKLGGKDVKHSPFTVNVAGSQQKSSHLSVGSTSEVALNISETELKGVSASIKSPSGIEEPCFVRIIEGGRLGVSFTPREAGEHLISVKRNGKLVPRAPFRIKVDKSQVGDASKVVVSGPGKSKAVTMADNEILVDTSKAGYGGLSVSVQGPSKAELTCKEKQPGLIAVNYKPTEPGIYVVHIKFADHHVKDSPLTVVCTGKSAGVAQTNIEKQAAQQPIALVGQDSHMYLKLPNTNALNMVARLQNPKGMNEDVEMRDVGENFYQISFKPKMEGLHALSVLFKDHHIHGSPFNFTVGSFSEGGPHKVRASGLGVVRGETKFPNSFNIYTREAGQGKLSVAIEGPSKAKVDFKDHKDGNCHVDYTVQQPGEYKIAVKFNDQHIPDSPFKVFIAPSVGEVRKLELAQFQDQGVPVGKAFTFTVLTHRAKGNLEAKVTSPRGETETIDIVPIEEGESYAMRFIPKESGNHYVHVTLDGSPMRDSPFLLRVGGRDESDPTAIHATGEGLVHGTTGQKCEFIINTCNAGAGVLSVQMDGPSKVTLDAYELEHGYKARYTPMAPGDYICAIKYNSIHIPGSPFKIKVDGKKLGGSDYQESSTVTIDAAAKTSKGTVAVAPTYTGDASKVTVKGAGLNKFFPNRVANFQIDTGLAGPNLLFVGVVTTKGPCEEVIVKHIGNGRYVVNYKVTDRAKGFIFVKYGDEEIPGSPFAIEP